MSRIVSKRLIVSTLMLSFVTFFCMEDVIRFANDYNMPMTIFIIPHLFSNIHFVFFYGLIVCYLFSDIYVISNEHLFEMLRLGKNKYLFGRIVLSTIQALWLYVSVIVTAIIMSFHNITWELGWGRLIHALCNNNIENKYQIIATGHINIENNYNPFSALIYSCVITVLVSTFIALIIYCIGTTLGSSFSIVISAFICTTTYLQSLFEQRLFYFLLSPFNWLRLSLFNQEYENGCYYPDFSSIALLTTVLISILMIVDFKLINNRDLVLQGE